MEEKDFQEQLELRIGDDWLKEKLLYDNHEKSFLLRTAA